MAAQSDSTAARLVFTGLLLCGALLVGGTVDAPASMPPGHAAQMATFSIVARDPDTGDLGVAVQSRHFGVGSVVLHARADVGAPATQARGNILFGPQGLGLLESGVGPEETIARLLADDPLRARRQVGMVAADGRAATCTGDGALP